MGGNTQTMVYGPNRARIQKSVGGVTTDYLIDSNRAYHQVLVESDGSTELSYTFGTDLVGLSSGAGSYTYHTDALGSTRLLSNDSGSIADEIRYDAWGDLLSGGDVVENNYLYTGEQFDGVLEDYYLRARYYDPNQGRFTQQDSFVGFLNEPVSLHKYQYADLDPVSRVDPSGNFSLVSVMRTVGIVASLATAGQTGYSIGESLVGQVSGEDPISLDKASAQNIGMAIALTYGGAKLAKMVLNKKRYKKLLKKRQLYRGVAKGSASYDNAKRGYISGSNIRFLDPRTYFGSTAEKHNNYVQFNTPFSSWTPKRGIAKTFATDGESGKGMIVSAKIRTFRIFKSPDKFAGFDSIKLRAHTKEYEFLVVGPVYGIPSFVSK